MNAELYERMQARARGETPEIEQLEEGAVASFIGKLALGAAKGIGKKVSGALGGSGAGPETNSELVDDKDAHNYTDVNLRDDINYTLEKFSLVDSPYSTKVQNILKMLLTTSDISVNQIAEAIAFENFYFQARLREELNLEDEEDIPEENEDENEETPRRTLGQRFQDARDNISQGIQNALPKIATGAAVIGAAALAIKLAPFLLPKLLALGITAVKANWLINLISGFFAGDSEAGKMDSVCLARVMEFDLNTLKEKAGFASSPFGAKVITSIDMLLSNDAMEGLGEDGEKKGGLLSGIGNLISGGSNN